MKLQSKEIRNYKLKEFPENPIRFAEPILIYKLDDLRDFMGAPIFPSPVQGALARFDLASKTSQHSAIDRKSTAIDIFCDLEPFEVLTKILFSSYFCRVGIYFDTYFKHKKWVMFHVDLKEQSLLWFRDKNDSSLTDTDYYYYSTEKDFYSRLFNKFSQEVFQRYRGVNDKV